MDSIQRTIYQQQSLSNFSSINRFKFHHQLQVITLSGSSIGLALTQGFWTAFIQRFRQHSVTFNSLVTSSAHYSIGCISLFIRILQARIQHQLFQVVVAAAESSAGTVSLFSLAISRFNGGRTFNWLNGHFSAAYQLDIVGFNITQSIQLFFSRVWFNLIIIQLE